MTGNGATFSACRRYRYRWWRIADQRKPTVTFIGLNPSKANEDSGDRTADQCVKYAEFWGYGGVIICNLFALCETKWAIAKASQHLTSLDNDEHIQDCVNFSELTIVAWGNNGVFKNRAAEVL